MIAAHDNNVGVSGILMIKCGVLVLRRSEGSYSMINIQDGHIQYDYTWYDEEGIRRKCMELNQKDYPMAGALYE